MMARNVRPGPEAVATAAAPIEQIGDFSRLAADWQRLFAQALHDFGWQARLERSEEREARWPVQVWALQSELFAAQTARWTRLFEESLAAALDLQSRWFKQVEAASLVTTQTWWPGAGKPAFGVGSPFAAWNDIGNVMLSAMRNDLEDAPGG
jgi:hypothetical protein